MYQKKTKPNQTTPPQKKKKYTSFQIVPLFQSISKNSTNMHNNILQ